jgi:hypothetical protein
MSPVAAPIHPPVEECKARAGCGKADKQRREPQGQHRYLLAEAAQSALTHLGDLKDLCALLDEDLHRLLPGEQALRNIRKLDSDILQRRSALNRCAGHGTVRLRRDVRAIDQHAFGTG